MRRLFLIVSGFVMLSGCQSNLSSFESVLVDGKLGEFVGHERLSCELDRVDYHLDAKVLGFEITSSGGINFGFNLLDGFFRALGLSFKLKQGQMVMAMDLSDGLRSHEYVANTQGVARMSGTEFSANIDAGMFRLGADYYMQTPLAKLSEKGLRDSFANLNHQLKSNDLSWSTRIYRVPSQTEVIIPTGAVAGLKLGDRLRVTPTQHHWAGEPCKSTYLISRKVPEAQSQVGEIVAIEANVALLAVASVENNGHRIGEGDLVEIETLTDAKKRSPLGRAVRVRKAESEKIRFDDGTEVDLLRYLRDQIRSVAKDYQFYIVE